MKIPRKAVFFLIAALLTGGCEWYGKEIPFSPEHYPGFMESLSFSPTSVAADGFSQTTVSAKLKDPAPGHVIVFSTTNGSFSQTESVPTVEVPVGPDGTASTRLTSPIKPGEARVDAKVKTQPNVARFAQINFVPVTASDILRFTAAPQDIEADGATLHTIAIETAPGLFDGIRTVAFTSTRGSFVGGTGNSATATIQRDNTATVRFVSPRDVGQAVIVATVGGFSQTHIVELHPALPHRLTLDLSGFVLTAGPKNEHTFTAHLYRRSGKVSGGIDIRFSATDSLGDAIGSFRAVQPSSEGGVATANFSVGETGYRGWIRARAWVEAAPAIEAEASAHVVDPPDS